MESNKTRYEKGLRTVKEMVPNETFQMMQKMQEVDPDFWNMIISFGFGDVYARNGLSLAQREIVTLTTLITQGAFDQLEVHIRAALNVGLTQAEIKEIIIQCAAYTGFPKATQAMQIAGKIFSE
ncbi:carboxymuconolactone decarboxylase family protein [Metabacillus malikii]|uniref:4-carboxymuconolactone decarboxylase n=1 Tax=Metabacillus malikii TaxID=1504265 RepID=A0ABT9ZDM7_9BACI|nr:carboxymuconolactone decarboxylase family protein [Metabacillus malikii]MDQ0230339.1 4-carboxymuconolactone decarboxylase [Metabacillus malikii]